MYEIKMSERLIPSQGPEGDSSMPLSKFLVLLASNAWCSLATHGILLVCISLCLCLHMAL